MLLIEPLSQSDRASLNSCFSDSQTPQSRVSFFSPRHVVGRKERVMSTKLACPVVPAIEICPNCKSEMIVAQVTPTFLADGFEDVIYRCKGCHSDVKRMFKQGLGTWELV